MVEKSAKHGRPATSGAKLATPVLSPVGPKNFSEHYYGVPITSTPHTLRERTFCCSAHFERR